MSKLEVSARAWFGFPPRPLAPLRCPYKPHVTREVSAFVAVSPARCVLKRSGYCVWGGPCCLQDLLGLLSAVCRTTWTPHNDSLHIYTQRYVNEFRRVPDAPTLHVTGLAARAPHASTPCIQKWSTCSSPAACGRSSRSIGTWPRALLGS